MTTIAITGATGQLGRLVIDALLARGVPAASLVAAVRDTAKAADLAAKGVAVRAADYDQPATLDTAFAGVDRLLLISSNAVGQRFAQHSAVIEAAKRAGVKLVAYTSLLHADTSPLALAAEHVATERALAASGLPHVLLRNGWYVENYLLSVPTALQHGALLGSAGAGRISCASRADYADAAAAVLAGAADPAGQVHELAGDDNYSLAELAAEIAAQAGKPVAYNDLPEAAFKDVLVSVGLPEGFAGLLADSDAGAAKGALFDGGKGISALTGKPTVTLKAAVAGALKG